VLDEAIKTCKQWHDLGYTEISISVNISSIQLKRGNFEQVVSKTLEKYSMEGRYLILELTESILLDMHQELAESIGVIESTGVRLAIDDFGTGYSNLGYLKKLDSKMLKIDRSFISKINDSSHDLAIVKAIIDMSNSLEIETVAEGIENEESVNRLLSLNDTVGQGYFWNKPMPSVDFIKANAES
jgi:EAL domain-containing protein (putative c-di-GMP-specific phosphodiesterase class I)